MLSPAPTLLSEDMRAHSGGYGFTKQSLVTKLKNALSRGVSQKLNQLSCVICTAANSDDWAEKCLAESEYFVYAGTGVGYEYGVQEASSPYDLLSSADELPKIVVICLSYGAQAFAEQVSRLPNAGGVIYVVWVNACVTDVIKLLQYIADEGVTSRDGFVEDCSSILRRISHGLVNGQGIDAVKNSSPQLSHIKNIGEGGLMSIHNDSMRPLNNILSDEYGQLNKSKYNNLSLAAIDVELFKRIESLNHTNIISIKSDDQHPNRSRAVMFELVKKNLSLYRLESDKFEAVWIIEEENMLQKFKKDYCDEKHSISNIAINGKILLWCDFQSCSVEAIETIKHMAETKKHDITILVTIQHSAEYDLMILNKQVSKFLEISRDAYGFPFKANYTNLKLLCECLQRIVGSGVEVISAYDNGVKLCWGGVTSIVVRVLVTDEVSQVLFWLDDD
jgi:hypothetical protein